jgi:hypothetical protein
VEKQMPADRKINRLGIEREAAKTVLVLRKRWLKQLLDWPLKDGPLAGRLIKAEIASLGKAAKQGKLFYGSPQASEPKSR